MLHKETVEPNILDLIRELLTDPKFASFDLVGGTALSLQIGHRISVDIDLFTIDPFNNQECLEYLEKEYGFALQYMHHNTLKGFIRGVFVDLIQHDYNLVMPRVFKEGIRMQSIADIAAMKVNAISGNGTRAKDFIDIYFLLKEFSFGDIISFYNQKYGSRNEFHALKSLTYFNDIIVEDWPNMVLEKDLSIQKVKDTITRHRNAYLGTTLN